jgi:hypothetical protein
MWDKFGDFLKQNKDMLSGFGNALPIVGNYMLSRSASKSMLPPDSPAMRSRVSYDKNLDVSPLTRQSEQSRTSAYRAASTVADPRVSDALRRRADSAYFRSMMDIAAQKRNHRKELEGQEVYANAFVDMDNVKAMNQHSDMMTMFGNQQAYDRSAAGINALTSAQLLKREKNQKIADKENFTLLLNQFPPEVKEYFESLIEGLKTKNK